MPFSQADKERAWATRRAWGQKTIQYGCDECADRRNKTCKLEDPCKYAATFAGCDSYCDYIRQGRQEQMQAYDRENYWKQQPWRAKPMVILDTGTGHRYQSIAAAAKAIGCNESYLEAHLKGAYDICKGHILKWVPKI